MLEIHLTAARQRSSLKGFLEEKARTANTKTTEKTFSSVTEVSKIQDNVEIQNGINENECRNDARRNKRIYRHKSNKARFVKSYFKFYLIQFVKLI